MTTTMRQLLLFALLATRSVLSVAQPAPVPVVTSDERFVVFDGGRFIRLEERPARQWVLQPGRLLYEDHQGALKVYRSDGRALNLLDRGPLRSLAGTAARVAWMTGDTLRTLHGGRVVELAHGVERFTVSDSMVTFHEHIAGTLQVWHGGRLHQIAEVERSTAAPQWAQGRDAVVFHDQQAARLWIYRCGEVSVLVDSTRMAVVGANGGPLAWWDEHRETLRILDGADTVDASGTRPVGMKAAPGVIAFVDRSLHLKAYQGGAVTTVADTMPAGYDVVDSVLVFPQGNRLMRFSAGTLLTVEPYLPEAWAIAGGRLVYLDLDRVPRSIGPTGDRQRLGRERGVKHISAEGDAVVLRATDGAAHVLRNGKVYTYAP